MSVLQKIFTPGSLIKKKALPHGDVERSEQQRFTSPSASVTNRIKRKPTVESDDDDDRGPLARSVSMTLNCDPVPTSFKTNSSFATQSKAAPASASPKSVRLGASFSNGGTHLDRHHQHTATLASSTSRHTQRSMFDKMQTNSSFAPGDTVVPGASFAANGAGTVNLWRLPWTQQKVTMCPNCHRPRQRERTNAYVSRADYAAPPASDAVEGMGDDISEASEEMSCDDSEGVDGPVADSTTYCRCRAAAAAGTALQDAGGSAEEHPPVFVVETERSSTVQLPGTIASDSDSDGGDVEGLQRSYKLSLVSPLTCSSLRRREPGSQPMLGAASRQTSSATSVPRSVSNWLHEQQSTEGPKAPKPKAAAK
ncbi:hypothetical protein NESM_000131600 [Novymonas esmeraldas]|uniref:Uncharacterized protein n=1 Tax=Novymonas esmeraldas TaxID=1808958 RepID=A0AAW0F508_9TRYP